MLIARDPIVFAAEGTLIYCLFRLRAAARALSQPRSTCCNTRLEIGYRVGAALMLVVITAVTFIKLDDIRDAQSDQAGQPTREVGVQETDTPIDRAGKGRLSGRSLQVQVNGQQYVALHGSTAIATTRTTPSPTSSSCSW